MGSFAEDMQLSREERIGFNLCLLHLMNRDLVATGTHGKKRSQRMAIRTQLRNALVEDEELTLESPGRLALEDWTVLSAFLDKLADLGHNLSILVELSVAQPWYNEKVSVSTEARRIALDEVARALGHTVSVDAQHIEEWTKSGGKLSGRLSNRALWIIGAGAVGVFLTGGVLAVPIAGTLGSMGTLAGAAAVTHGLAILGGGSLAAGGLGMAGGTALLGGVGAVAGAGLGTAATRRSLDWDPDEVAVEALKSYALIRALRLRQETCGLATRAVEALNDRRLDMGRAISEEKARGESCDRKKIKKLEALSDQIGRLLEELGRSR